MNSTELRKEVVKNGVKRLKRFGFLHVDKTNIFRDEVYKEYFFRILLDQLGENVEDDQVIKNLIIEIKD